MTSHFTFLSWVGHHCDDAGLENAIATAIENARRIWQRCSGNRIHPMITRIGGLRIHPESEWQPTLGEWLDDANALVTWLRTALDATVGVYRSGECGCWGAARREGAHGRRQTSQFTGHDVRRCANVPRPMQSTPPPPRIRPSRKTFCNRRSVKLQLRRNGGL